MFTITRVSLPTFGNNFPLLELRLVIVDGFTINRAQFVSVLPFFINREIGVFCCPTCYTNRELPPK